MPVTLKDLAPFMTPYTSPADWAAVNARTLGDIGQSIQNYLRIQAEQEMNTQRVEADKQQAAASLAQAALTRDLANQDRDATREEMAKQRGYLRDKDRSQVVYEQTGMLAVPGSREGQLVLLPGVGQDIPIKSQIADAPPAIPMGPAGPPPVAAPAPTPAPAAAPPVTAPAAQPPGAPPAAGPFLNAPAAPAPAPAAQPPAAAPPQPAPAAAAPAPRPAPMAPHPLAPLPSPQPGGPTLALRESNIVTATGEPVDMDVVMARLGQAKLQLAERLKGGVPADDLAAVGPIIDELAARPGSVQTMMKTFEELVVPILGQRSRERSYLGLNKQREITNERLGRADQRAGEARAEEAQRFKYEQYDRGAKAASDALALDKGQYQARVKAYREASDYLRMLNAHPNDPGVAQRIMVSIARSNDSHLSNIDIANVAVTRGVNETIPQWIHRVITGGMAQVEIDRLRTLLEEKRSQMWKATQADYKALQGQLADPMRGLGREAAEAGGTVVDLVYAPMEWLPRARWERGLRDPSEGASAAAGRLDLGTQYAPRALPSDEEMQQYQANPNALPINPNFVTPDNTRQITVDPNSATPIGQQMDQAPGAGRPNIDVRVLPQREPPPSPTPARELPPSPQGTAPTPTPPTPRADLLVDPGETPAQAVERELGALAAAREKLLASTQIPENEKQKALQALDAKIARFTQMKSGRLPGSNASPLPPNATPKDKLKLLEDLIKQRQAAGAAGAGGAGP